MYKLKLPQQKTVIFFLLVLLTSCSPQKRLERLIEKYPYLLTFDTLTYRDTIYTNAITIDTAFITSTIDTILITKDKLTTQIIRHYDSIFVFSNYNGDTIYIDKRIPFPIIKSAKDNYKYYFFLTTGSTLMLLFLIILFFIFNRRK